MIISIIHHNPILPIHHLLISSHHPLTAPTHQQCRFLGPEASRPGPKLGAWRSTSRATGAETAEEHTVHRHITRQWKTGKPSNSGKPISAHSNLEFHVFHVFNRRIEESRPCHLRARARKAHRAHRVDSPRGPKVGPSQRNGTGSKKAMSHLIRLIS